MNIGSQAHQAAGVAPGGRDALPGGDVEPELAQKCRRVGSLRHGTRHQRCNAAQAPHHRHHVHESCALLRRARRSAAKMTLSGVVRTCCTGIAASSVLQWEKKAAAKRNRTAETVGKYFLPRAEGRGVYIWRKSVHTRARGVCKKKKKIII